MGTQGSSTKAESESPADQSDDKTVKVPVHCINLLRCNIQVSIFALQHSHTIRMQLQIDPIRTSLSAFR